MSSRRVSRRRLCSRYRFLVHRRKETKGLETNIKGLMRYPTLCRTQPHAAAAPILASRQHGRRSRSAWVEGRVNNAARSLFARHLSRFLTQSSHHCRKSRSTQSSSLQSRWGLSETLALDKTAAVDKQERSHQLLTRSRGPLFRRGSRKPL